MSFMDAKRRGPERELRPVGREGPLEKDLHDLERQGFKVQTGVAKFKRLVDRLGGRRDTGELRSQLAVARSSLQDETKEVMEKVVGLNAQREGLTKRQQERLNRAGQNFTAVLEDFEKALKRCSDGEAAPPRAESAALSEASDDPLAAMERQALLQHQQRQEAVVMDSVVAHNESLIEERDQGITAIVRDIGELHEMFQDVSTLVTDQGAMLDDIETNITHASGQVEAGANVLGRADQHQKSATRMRMCLAVIVAIIIAIVVIAVTKN
ncbi:unnamed protein product [Ostreobium quekettii]|uniref:t-SNARE coiled-coil homology domain-containing protein n=1 Tax=Ostreobium quekettii TaxID=121088 RepID=A0A8S1JB55_9CHLO|nr:unnamed protein product [Ostreobium quekettii]|eukprot:evm.model.scf_62EXC.4 EVM.evm.TU.scf_62EXC.4   scf_62EXC:49214-56252(+)